MHRPVSEEVHLSAVAVDYGVVALQGAVSFIACNRAILFFRYLACY
ncbi:MAG: hypothetical protein WCI81_06820 [Chlorobiaceae bacterium]